MLRLETGPTADPDGRVKGARRAPFASGSACTQLGGDELAVRHV
jgi:hypothetical protein